MKIKKIIPFYFPVALFWKMREIFYATQENIDKSNRCGDWEICWKLYHNLLASNYTL